ncbi:hypothetical protein [Streptomyces venezuelae]|nr:hypothetical protein [Streptomyces venezuelae]
MPSYLAEVADLQDGDDFEGAADEEDGECVFGDGYSHDSVVFAVGLCGAERVAAGGGEGLAEPFADLCGKCVVDGLNPRVVLQPVDHVSSSIPGTLKGAMKSLDGGQ